MSLYESLDDLLQAADDYNCNGSDDEDDEDDLVTEEVLEKRQEYANFPLSHWIASERYIGLKVDFLPSKSSYKCFRQSERQLKTRILIWICI